MQIAGHSGEQDSDDIEDIDGEQLDNDSLAGSILLRAPRNIFRIQRGIAWHLGAAVMVMA